MATTGIRMAVTDPSMVALNEESGVTKGISILVVAWQSRQQKKLPALCCYLLSPETTSLARRPRLAAMFYHGIAATVSVARDGSIHP